MTVLVFAELDGESVADASLRAVTLARDLGTPVTAAVFAVANSGGAGTSAAEVLGDYGVSGIYEISVTGYAPQAWGRALAGLIADTGATAVLAASTDHGAEVLAHLGAITGLPVAANVVAISRGESAWNLTRHRWAGLLLEDALLDAPVALITVVTDAVVPEPAPCRVAPEMYAVKPEVAQADLAVSAVTSTAGAGGASLATARAVVGGGRGVGGPDGFAPLEELAGLLGGVVGVSRVVTSEGWRPHTMQVGQTGTRISPELYVACGISGAIQHIAGCSGAKHIIAINTDPAAPILAHADYAVIGDLHKVIPALVAAIKSR